MFDNRTFRRGIEYTLSDALAKRIESDTPYKIVSDRDRTDSVSSGQLVVITESILTIGAGNRPGAGKRGHPDRGGQLEESQDRQDDDQ